MVFALPTYANVSCINTSENPEYSEDTLSLNLQNMTGVHRLGGTKALFGPIALNCTSSDWGFWCVGDRWDYDLAIFKSGSAVGKFRYTNQSKRRDIDFYCPLDEVAESTSGEIDLDDVAMDMEEVDRPFRMEGFCFSHVLDMERSTERMHSTEQGLTNYQANFLQRAERRAVAIYKDYGNDEHVVYNDVAHGVDEGFPLNIESVAIFRTKESSIRLFLGAIVKIAISGEEDEVTFYFSNWWSQKSAPKLLMAYHEEQSPVAYWTCEYE